MLHQSYPALLLQAGFKRAGHEAQPAAATAVMSAVVPSQASQVVMQLEGYCPESFPLDVKQQVCRRRQRWLSQLISVSLTDFHDAILSADSTATCALLPGRWRS